MESDAFSEGPTQRGMDRYLDSLFDPVLSDGSMVSTDGNVFNKSVLLKRQTSQQILIIALTREIS